MALPSKLMRSNVLVAIIIACGVAAAALGLTQMWASPFGEVALGKSLATIGILGLMAGFVGAVDTDMMPAGRRRLMLFALMGMGVFCGALCIAQMWWTIMDWTDFTKVLITAIVLIVLDGFIMAVWEDLGTTRKLKDDKYID